MPAHPAESVPGMMTDMFGSLHRNGLTRIIVINGHGGNVVPIFEVTRELYRKTSRPIPSLYLWRIAYGLLPKIVDTPVRGFVFESPPGGEGTALVEDAVARWRLPAEIVSADRSDPDTWAAEVAAAVARSVGL